MLNYKFSKFIRFKSVLNSKTVPVNQLKALNTRAMFLEENLSIKLNEVEQKITDLLLNSADNYNRDKPDQEKVSLRFAGGWVRDKLLHPETDGADDIDVAIENLSGYEFGKAINSYLDSKDKDSALIHLVKILKNPEKSKHLETTNIRLFDKSVDLVQLRNEEYSKDSRIPIDTTAGSPLEDAHRRDITINSLFYNIHKRTVEDFTEKGLADLRNGIIRTPIDPLKTFTDDPLRILRCIRFAARFNFKLDDSILEVAKLVGIQSLIKDKISKERVGTEFEKTTKGPNKENNVTKALEYINSMNLYETLFYPRVNFSGVEIEKINSGQCVKSLHNFYELANLANSDQNLPHLKQLFEELKDTGAQSTVLIALSLSPFVSYRNLKNKITVFESIIKNNLKRSNKISKAVNAYYMSYDIIAQFRSKDLPSRIEIGNYILKANQHWKGSLIVYLCIATNPSQINIASYWCNKLIEKIYTENLQEFHNQKPVLAGHKIAEILEIKPSNIITDISAQLKQKFLEDPALNEESAADWIQKTYKKAKLDQ